MNRNTWAATVGAAASLLVHSAQIALGQGQSSGHKADQAVALSEQEAYSIAKDAYVFAYPLMLTHTTLQKLSNFAEPVPGDAYGPPNQFHHVRKLADPEAKVVIRTNVDTLYSAAVLDLKAEPMVLSVPATDRYFMLPMLSLWTDVFAVPGTRTTGRNTARDFWWSVLNGKAMCRRDLRSSGAPLAMCGSSAVPRPTALPIMKASTRCRTATS